MKFLNKSVAIIIFVALFVGLIPSLYFYSKWREASKAPATSTEVAKQEAAAYVAKIAKYMELPEEEPTVANVVDVAKLGDQPFFAKAKNGDRVLIFSTAKLAILYDPTANRVINVAPVNVGTPSASTTTGTTAGATTTASTMVLRNGTTIVGLTRTYEESIKSHGIEIKIIDRENAKKRDYTKTILIDMTGTKALEAKELAAKLGVTVSKLPEGEATASADFVIIVGEDQKP